MAAVFDIQGGQRKDFKMEFEIKDPVPLFKICLSDQEWVRCGEFWWDAKPKMRFFLELKSAKIRNNTEKFSVLVRLQLVEVKSMKPTYFVLSTKFFYREGSFAKKSPVGSMEKKLSWEEQRNNRQPETWERELLTWRHPAVNVKLTVGVKLSLIIGRCWMPELPLPLPDGAGDDSLSSDMGQLLLSGREADVVVGSPDGQEFPAHRLILATRSPVFSAMFQQDMQEAKEGKVSIGDFSADVIQEFLHFLYTGCLLDEENSINIHSQDLLAIADKYDVRGLKRKAELFLVGNLNVDTGVELLCLGDAHHAETLTSAAIAFIRGHLSIYSTGGLIQTLAKERLHLLDLIYP